MFKIRIIKLAKDLAFFQEFFQGAKSIVMQISFIMLIFLLFSDQILGGAKVSEGSKLLEKGAPPPPFYPVEESQKMNFTQQNSLTFP